MLGEVKEKPPSFEMHMLALGRLCIVWAYIDRLLNDAIQAALGCTHGRQHRDRSQQRRRPVPIVASITPACPGSDTFAMTLSQIYNCLDPEVVRAEMWNAARIKTIRSFRLFSSAYCYLVEQSLGFRGEGHKPERSAAGDLFHLIYLPHCDLWRGDRRFTNVVSQSSPDVCGSLVGRLIDLPSRIDAHFKQPA